MSSHLILTALFPTPTMGTMISLREEVANPEFKPPRIQTGFRPLDLSSQPWSVYKFSPREPRFLKEGFMYYLSYEKKEPKLVVETLVQNVALHLRQCSSSPSR